ncbi:ankyrin repeat and SOCS box protein 18 [Bombina bombina]|uniref:ankyrin repeat and SOCS box protein 18 n=1 Tax=Bombina bombina TaxID=8345 RepID=UPI00235AAFFF|nr:ankyrin repeat and SOCS box protein 18 [Bombina bombina]
MDCVRSKQNTQWGPQALQGPENRLFTALENGDLHLLRILGARHADSVLQVRGGELRYRPQAAAQFGLSGLWSLEYTQELTSPLCITCARGYTECVRYLLHRRADPNASPGGSSPLHKACAGGHGDCVQLLLEHGANPNIMSDAGETPLHYCDINKSLRCAQLLLDYGAELNQATESTQDTPLHMAARLNLLAHAQLYLHHGASVHFQNQEGETPLTTACGAKVDDEDSSLALCHLLLERGADLEIPDQQDRRPLHHACRAAKHRVVELLLCAGADVNATDYNGVSPLSWALQAAELKLENRPHLIVHILLNHGAHIFCPDMFGKVLRCCSRIPQIIGLLYNSYRDLQTCEQWKCEIPEEVIQAHHSFYTTFFNLSGSVRSLQHLCRFTLRRHLGCRCHSLIPLLPVPRSLQEYLLLDSKLSLS